VLLNFQFILLHKQIKELNLIIDIGNTNSKLAVFKETEMVEFKIFNQNLSEDDISSFDNHNCVNALVIATGKENSAINDYLETEYNLVEFTNKVNLPFQSDYETPHTLGLDRVANVAGAVSITMGPLLIIDLGTCITYDFVDKSGVYKGGAISSGLQMRLKALNTFTDKLPF